MKGDALDPKGLIQDAYRIEGITEAECRVIFLDWALSMGEGDLGPQIAALLERHGVEGHPMTTVLRAGLDGPVTPRRRGGHRARPRG
ncbi:hypothetical protein [Citreimonas salinaria]|uniref:Uncharacterized protein n=1 Tax=Citreimonas salinaria TaxID=321339 RepID=A0A1H3GE37_9RHOB|nr:hypothetical protein [Citreimonas salinaria]SDY01583.1 hypothetical protein SAMN05444340_102302 [Citreimonas salinaria]